MVKVYKRVIINTLHCHHGQNKFSRKRNLANLQQTMMQEFLTVRQILGHRRQDAKV